MPTFFSLLETNDGFDIQYHAPLTDKTHLAYRIKNLTTQQKSESRAAAESIMQLCENVYLEGYKYADFFHQRPSGQSTIQ